jgi:hypothetical protein
MRLPIYAADGSALDSRFTNNPAWVILDLLRRCGWNPSEINLGSFAAAAEYAAEQIEAVDFAGQSVAIPRFGCNLVLRNRRSAADIIRGVRNSCGFRLKYDSQGALELTFDSTFAREDPTKPEGSNSIESIAGGWPCYEFGDGSTFASDLLRLPDGSSSLRIWCRPTSESTNRYSLEFQDEFNAYQQDSLSLVDIPDAVANGFEVSAMLPALGVPNFHQAGRMLRLALDRSVRGNSYAEFQTGPRGIGLRPGDLITLTYAKEGLFRQPFRVLHVALGSNYRTARITAQLHDDAWYADTNGPGELASRDLLIAGRGGAPRGLLGANFDTDGTMRFAVSEQYVERNDGAFDVTLTAQFRRPSSGLSLKASAPFVSLAANVTTGGDLAGPATYFYAVTAVDEDGLEGPVSFLVPVHVPSDAGSTVTLNQIRSGKGSTSLKVYRGKSPSDLMLIAETDQVSSAFEDNGLPSQVSAPPDPNYDHANLYWRSELLPPTQVSLHGPDQIGSTTLAMLPGEFASKVVRITHGVGRGQERVVSDNSKNILNVRPAWTVLPDETSSFVVADNGWKLGCTSTTDSGTFGVPNRRGAGIHILGLAANAQDFESSRDTALFSRHVTGGAAFDMDVPPVPLFALSSTGRGELTISAVGFETAENTRSVNSGTLTLHCWDELANTPPTLVGPMDATSDIVELSSELTAPEGYMLQIGSELMRLWEDAQSTLTCRVERGAFGTTAVDHATGSRVHLLSRRVVVLSFPRDFFGSAASGNYEHTVDLRCVRIAAAELFVTNLKGNSQVTQATFAGHPGAGLRTLSGGQICLQVDGVLSVQASAVTPLILDRDYAVRSIYAVVEEPATEVPVQVQVTLNGIAYGPLLEIEALSTKSTEVAGGALPTLRSQDRLSLDIVSVAGAAYGFPGARLTVCVRT